MDYYNRSACHKYVLCLNSLAEGSLCPSLHFNYWAHFSTYLHATFYLQWFFDGLYYRYYEMYSHSSHLSPRSNSFQMVLLRERSSCVSMLSSLSEIRTEYLLWRRLKRDRELTNQLNLDQGYLWIIIYRMILKKLYNE